MGAPRCGLIQQPKLELARINAPVAYSELGHLSKCETGEFLGIRDPGLGILLTLIFLISWASDDQEGVKQIWRIWFQMFPVLRLPC